MKKTAKRRLLQMLFPAVTLALCFALCFIAPLVQKNGLAAAQYETNLTGSADTPIWGVELETMQALQSVPVAMYTPGEFLPLSVKKTVVVPPSDGRPGYEYEVMKKCVQGVPFTFGKDTAAAKGTFQFVFFNFDPSTITGEQEDTLRKERMKLFLQGDQMYHATLAIPPVYSACAVYVTNVFTDGAGALTDYDTIDYVNYNQPSDKHAVGSKPIYVDLQFSSRKNAVNPDRIEAARIVTVHYESESARLAGIRSMPVAGLEKEVKAHYNTQENTLFVTISLIALCVVVLFALILLKRKWRLAGLGLTALSVVLLLSFCRMSLGELSGYALLFFVRYFAAALLLVSAVLGFLAAGFFKRWDGLSLCNPVFAVFLTVLLPFADLAGNAVGSVYYVSLLCIPILLAGIVREFFVTERRNRYLTANLQTEVAAQTGAIAGMLSERERLIAIISHDLKKPADSITSSVAALRVSELSPGERRHVENISGKTDGILSALTEIAACTKLNYNSEAFRRTDVNALICGVEKDLRPDCDASGVALTVRVSGKLFAHVKSSSLKSALENLIFNAIEHSGCSEITVTSRKQGGVCFVTVRDNGGGFRLDDPFSPYASTSDRPDSGLGLYLVKSEMENMGGSVHLDDVSEGASVTLTLPAES